LAAKPPIGGRGLIILGLPVPAGPGEDAKLGAFGRLRPPGNRRPAAAGGGEAGEAPVRAPPTNPPGPADCCAPRIFCAEGGAPCLDRENAFILACISEFRPLARLGSGAGLLAALVGPRGAEEGLMENDALPRGELKDGGLEPDSKDDSCGTSGADIDRLPSGSLGISGEDDSWDVVSSMVDVFRLYWWRRCAAQVLSRRHARVTGARRVDERGMMSSMT
jgi:hypothetical protein